MKSLRCSLEKAGITRMGYAKLCKCNTTVPVADKTYYLDSWYLASVHLVRNIAVLRYSLQDIVDDCDRLESQLKKAHAQWDAWSSIAEWFTARVLTSFLHQLHAQQSAIGLRCPDRAPSC
nr:hypothetical protein CFP56_02596 [Quercus suber]